MDFIKNTIDALDFARTTFDFLNEVEKRIDDSTGQPIKDAIARAKASAESTYNETLTLLNLVSK